MNVLRHWTVEDREHLAVVTLGAFEVPDRGELVRRITENYVPARHYRGAVSLLAEAATGLREAADLVAGGNVERDLRALADRIDATRGQ